MHWFIDPIKNHYADFDGRATRQELWMYMLMYMVVLFTVVIVFFLGMENDFIISIVLPLAMGLLFLGTFIPTLAIQIRRLHDIDKSGWWYLIGFIPYLGSLILIIFYCLPSKPGSNKWGPNPGGVEMGNPVGFMPGTTTTVTTTTVSTTTSMPPTQATSSASDINTDQRQ